MRENQLMTSSEGDKREREREKKERDKERERENPAHINYNKKHDSSLQNINSKIVTLLSFMC